MITVRTDQSSSLPAPIADRRASPLNVLPDLQARKHAVSSSGCVRDLELASTTAGGPRTKTQILPSGSWGAPSGTGTSVVAGGGAGTGAGVGATVGSGARSVVEDAASPALPLGTGTGMGEGGDNQAAAALSGHRIVDEPKFEAGRLTGWRRDCSLRPSTKKASEQGGGERIRTVVEGFAGPCLNHSATPPRAVPDVILYSVAVHGCNVGAGRRHAQPHRCPR